MTSPSIPSPPPQPEAQWSVSLDVDCPKCGKYVDLLDTPDFWDGRGGLHIAEAVPSLSVNCPKCDHQFTVSTIW